MLHSKNQKLWTCEYIRWRQRNLFTPFYICEITTSIHTETGNTSAWHLDECGAADSSESRLGQRLLVHYCHLVISIPLPAPFQSPVHVPHLVCPVWWEVFHGGHRERCTATLAALPNFHTATMVWRVLLMLLVDALAHMLVCPCLKKKLEKRVFVEWQQQYFLTDVVARKTVWIT